MTSAAIRKFLASTSLASAFVCFCWAAAALAAPKKSKEAPKPKMNNTYFFKMPRAFVEVVKTDSEKKSIQVRTKKGELRELTLRPESSVRIRDSWGELGDLYPGEWVMLFICPDAKGQWVFPRAVQDELEMMSSHGWQWKVESIDRGAGMVDLSRKEGKEGGQVVHETFRISDMTKVWKGETPTGLEGLQVGDVVLFQSRCDAGQEKRLIVEFFDANGLAVVKAAQLVKHLARLEKSGLPAVVNEIDLLPGTLNVSVQPEALMVAKEIETGDKFSIEGSDGSVAINFTATALDARQEHRERKLLLIGEPAEMVRLQVGDNIRLRPIKADPKAEPAAAEPAAAEKTEP